MNSAKIQQARNFFEAHRVATLSTHSEAREGFPFGSIVQHDVNELGEPIIYVSKISQHYKNLVSNPLASVFVVDANSLALPLTCARITLLLEFSQVDDAEREAVEASYMKRFPEAIDHRVAHDFVYLKGAIRHVRWIGGFGDIAWIDKEKFTETTRDEVAYASMPMIDHMNDDHQDALLDYMKAFAEPEIEASALRLCAVNSSGFTIRASNGKKLFEVQVPFDEPLSGPQDARKAFVSLLKRVRES